jgi:PAS domain-containing protein
MAGRVPDRDIPNKPSSPPRQNRLLLIIGAIIVGTFSLDLLAPSDFSAGIVLYFFALFFSSKLRAPYAPFLVVAIISVLALGAQFGIDGKGVNPALTNRLMILATLWAVAGLALYRITTDQTHIEQRATVESDIRLRDMVAESSLAILILNHKRDRLFVNQAMADLMGYENGDENKQARAGPGGGFLGRGASQRHGNRQTRLRHSLRLGQRTTHDLLRPGNRRTCRWS